MASLGTGTWKKPEYWAHEDPNNRHEPEKFPGWRFGPGGASGLFATEDEVPEGWTDNPNDHTAEAIAAVVKEPELPLADDLGREDVLAALDEAKVDYNPKWTTGRLNKTLRDSKEA